MAVGHIPRFSCLSLNKALPPHCTVLSANLDLHIDYTLMMRVFLCVRNVFVAMSKPPIPNKKSVMQAASLI